MLMCSEARVTQQINDKEIEMKGYTTIICYSKNRHTGGVALFLRNKLKHKIVINKPIDMMLWFLAIEIWGDGIDGIYGVFYRSPNKSVNTREALESFDRCLEETINLNKMNIIVGDININMNINDRLSNLLKSSLMGNDLMIMNNFNTRDNKANSTLIDLILTNKEEKVKCKH